MASIWGFPMTGTKAITPEALKQLGPKRLAELLADACENDRPLRRKIEILLASKQGGDKLERAIGKRISTLARARGFLDWREAPTLAAELAALREGIATELAARDPQAAMEQLWRFLDLAKHTMERADDSDGGIGGEFHSAADDLGAVFAKIPNLDRVSLAERLHASLAGDGYGFSARVITSGAEGMGPEGRTRLRELLMADIAALPARDENESWEGASWPRFRLSTHLADLADAERDVDAYIDAVRLGAREHIDAAHVAARLIAAGRPAESLAWLDEDRRAHGPFDLTIADLRIAALEALGKTTDAQELRWQAFEHTLSASPLRDYLGRLPDFEDFEAERRAIEHAAAFPSALTALSFLVEWPALDAADALVRRRIGELDGRHYDHLGKAAERLADKWPVSATLLYRALVLSVLDRGFSKAYKYAARDLSTAHRLGGRVPADGGIPDHAAFHASLKATHGRKYGFWNIVANEHRDGGE